MRNQINKRNTFAYHKNRRPSICTTEKYLQNYVPQQIVAPGIASYASATKSVNEKVCIIGDWDLKRTNKKQFVGNKAKGRISKRVFQENKARQTFRKMFVFRKIWRALFS